MQARDQSLSPDWIDQVFSARAVSKGGVVRRSVLWVENEIGRARFIQEVDARGFHLLECGGQFIVVCNNGPIRKLV
ncbi:MAG: N-(5'-phosphoribosyl)anthranilate isomerase [Pelagimonas sp.]|uniref:N-(5'-phosphoribosyl)anthranilate isomerase n=1 Tax=Pelagimonas sp. TaxID=2073170 RepID=UPI003D6AF86E